MKIGTYIDPIINKSYNLYIISARTLSNNLKSVYSKFHNIPNVEDFHKHQKNTKDSNIIKYENNFISLLCKNGNLDNLDNSILIDGYRRLFMSDVPEVDTFVKVYNLEDITLMDEVKLMMEFNYWKKFNKDRSSFFERGFSLWVYLKNGVNINFIKNRTELIYLIQTYLSYNEFYNDGDSKKFEELYFNNINLFDDIKFIYELISRTFSFSIGKKTYDNFSIPTPTHDFLYQMGNLRIENKKHNPININEFFNYIISNDVVKETLVDYSESINGEKKDRCINKLYDSILNYIKTEYFGFEKKKTVLEIQSENKKKFDEIKKKYSPVSCLDSGYGYGYLYHKDCTIEEFLSEIHNNEIIWVKNPSMKEMNTNTEIFTLKYIGQRTTYLIFEDENKNKHELTLHDMSWMVKRGTSKFYTYKDKSKIQKTKRPDFVIYEVHTHGNPTLYYLIKAKTIKRVVEIANDNTLQRFNINYQYIKDYCFELSHNSDVLELTKDMTEGIVYYKNRI